MSEIIIAGRPARIDAPVKQLIGTGLDFIARPTRRETRAVVWHWTGGGGNADRVLQTLRGRGLSINFIIDRDGTIVQCCDANRATAHAYDEIRKISANPWSVGIEVCGRGGRGVWWTPDQEVSCRALAGVLSAWFGLPMAYPADWRELKAYELREFRGHLGHHHVERVKPDPGPLWLPAILGTTVYGDVA